MTRRYNDARWDRSPRHLFPLANGETVDMRSRWWLGLVVLLVLSVTPVAGQELDCSVSVNYTQLDGTGFEFLENLEDRIFEYFNTHRWTEDQYLEFERINCEIQLILLEAPTLTSFQGRLAVSVRRPIYGTSQSSTVLQIGDDNIAFNYAQGTPLVHDVERYDPLTSVLDYYAYVMLGYDYDTFSELGGTPYFEQARRIADIAQGQGASGWAAVGETQSRVSLITQLLDPRFRPLRRAYKTYHLDGLDRFVQNTDEARQTILDTVESIRELYETINRQFAIDLFFTAKYQELTGVFSDSPLTNEAFNVLTAVDASHSTEYNKLVN